ncbi:hypothetical protein SRABI96_00382 [Peribacillus sp. Bi96]|nr:hypothetical protein SRABI96_00382 [Peribacillus sp. Bi96]
MMENIDYEGSKISKIHNSKKDHIHLIFEKKYYSWIL